jgi:hypothetical protein
LITVDELQAFLDAIETHAIDLVADVDPQDVYAGDVVYRASNGWTLTIFNDANEYDYVDRVTSADGRETQFDQYWDTEHDWRLDDELAWKCLGIPGYCIFRCTVCGARIRGERGRPMRAPYLCGEGICAGAGQPPNGTWIRVRT